MPSYRLASLGPLLVTVGTLALTSACHRPTVQLDPKNQTYAELRTVRRGVTVTPPGESARAPYPHERLADGALVNIAAGGRAWLRRDGGATLLIAGPATFTLRTDALLVDEGKLFVDTAVGAAGAEIQTPAGPLHLSGVRASLTVAKESTLAYVLKGELSTEGGVTATAGEELDVGAEKGKGAKHAVLAWDDWTGGLATTEESAEPAPFGVGTVGGRSPGARGQARFPLSIQKLDVRVTIDHDLAITEVDELFFNPSPETVEGIYKFRTPLGATIHRFGVDQGGHVVWGRVKEKAAAAAQYQSNVYAGSTEDPALLEWDAPGVYSARLYPIAAGGTRRVVTRYAEWLPRQGAHGERRLYVYPMAAEGASGSLPRIEEFRAVVSLGASGATDVRGGMHAARERDQLIVRGYDLTPRADLSVELFDGGEPTGGTAYRARHKVESELLAAEDLAATEKQGKSEADYVLAPVRPSQGAEMSPKAGAGEPLDVAIVVDTSAATDPAAITVARAATNALLSHLGPSDRAAVWASDASLRPVAPGSDELRPVDDARRSAIDVGLATIDRGGATDLGAVLALAAAKLDPARRGALVYIGDGKPTVGELSVSDLRERLNRLPHPARIFALGIGNGANLGVLSGVALGGFAERVVDGHGAAETALRLFEDAERPVWMGVKVDLGLGVDRIYPRESSALFADETTLIVGRLNGAEPTRVDIQAVGHSESRPLSTVWIGDDGDLKRRWAEGRLSELYAEGAGRAAVVEVGTRYGVVTPFTSYYVPTSQELSAEVARARPPVATETADSKEGGTGTRAKGEEGSMGNAKVAAAATRVASAAAARAPASAQMQVHPDDQTAASSFGMIGLLNVDGKAPGAPQAAWGNDIGNSFGAGGLGLSGIGEGGGGRGEGIGLGGIGTIGHGTGGGDGQGFGNGHGRLGGAHQTHSPTVRQGAVTINGEPADKANDAWKETTKNADAAKTLARPTVPVISGFFGFRVRACDASSEQPLEERVLLWRERLVDARRDPTEVAAVYSDALARCEAPTWADRARLLHVMLDAVGSVRQQVALWRVMFDQPGPADVLYRGLLARVHTTAEMRELHDALGLKRIDAALLATTLAAEKTPAAKVTKLRQLVLAWPDDLELALRLLDAYEDAGDIVGERTFARKLRRREDTNARVRTAIGEAYLRMAKAPGGSPKDEDEAKRTFGEIVEFAVDDPVARRRLGDLLRSHGWYEEAFRQYETLAKLTPDDTNVSLLLAIAAAGMGRVEEAVGWAEKAGVSSAPNGSGMAEVTRDLAAVILAWAEDEAKHAGRDKEAQALRERASRISAPDRAGGKNARVFLTWSHPEVHPTLWSNAKGIPQPTTRGDTLLGIAGVTFSLARTDAFVDVRVEPEDAVTAARLGAKVVLTVIYDEGTDDERVVRQTVPLAPTRPNGTWHFAVDRNGLREEAAR